jgi:RES domain-containing protein
MKIHVHPDRAKFASRLATLGRALDAPFASELFRFINPKYSKAADIVSGVGSLKASGRWNVPRTARLGYTSQTPETALAEAMAHVRYYNLPTSRALPRVLVALRFKARRVLDLRNGAVRRKLILSDHTIRTLDWRTENRNGVEALTQAWGFAFARAGLEAVVVPSAADPHGVNVLVFPGNLLIGSFLEVATQVTWL